MHIFACIEVFNIFLGGHTPGPPSLEDGQLPRPTSLTASRLDFSAAHLSSKPSVSCSFISNPTGKVREFHLAWRVVTPLTRSKLCFFTDEKNFYLNPPVKNQNDGVWASGRKSNVAAKRLLVECKNFAKHVMVSVGVCFGRKGELHFVAKKVKISSKHYIENLVNVCKKLLPNHIIFFSKIGQLGLRYIQSH